MKTQELFSIFESDIDNFIELTKEDLNDIRKDIKKNKKNTVAALKAILNMKAVASDIIKISEIYFNSSISQDIDELKNKPDMVEIIKNYLNHESADVKQKRGIVKAKETGAEKDYLKSGFYSINELFGDMVEYFAIAKNVAFANINEEQKPVLIIENLNSMLGALLSIEVTIKDNISTIIINEIKK